MMHYRSLTFYLPRSGGECTSDTAAIYPNGTQIPVWTAEETLIQAIIHLTITIKESSKSEPYHDLLDAQQNTLQELANVFQQFAPTQIKQKESQYPNIAPEFFPINIPTQKPTYHLPRVKTIPTGQPVPRVLPSIEIEGTATQNETFAHVITQEKEDFYITEKTTPRRSPRLKNKPKIHMGNFIKRIYLTEKHDLRNQWNSSTQVCHAITDPVTGNSLEYRDLIKDEKLEQHGTQGFQMI